MLLNGNGTLDSSNETGRNAASVVVTVIDPSFKEQARGYRMEFRPWVAASLAAPNGIRVV